MTYTLHLGDCLDVLKTLPDASIDAVVTDPPYELGFMGKKWDAAGIAYNVGLWAEALRVLKPGGHLLAFGGTRTYHRMACAIEDAGFEVRDSLHWLYGSGFPKSLDVSKAIDKAAGASGERGPMKRGGERLARLVDGRRDGNGTWGDESGRSPYTYLPATDAARQWNGWGTALKPAHEPVVVARKPLVGTVADNVQAHGTGALNVDGCRVGTEGGTTKGNPPKGKSAGIYGNGLNGACDIVALNAGRWPPNILLSHTPECGEACAEDCAVAEMDRQQGGASRFFPVFRYQSKAGRKEREAGLREAGLREAEVRTGCGGTMPVDDQGRERDRFSKVAANVHPTVKPVELMRWLVRLVTPPNGVVLDPFTGSGTTGVAAVSEGFRFVGVEREAEYHAIATARIQHALPQQVAQMELLP